MYNINFVQPDYPQTNLYPSRFTLALSNEKDQYTITVMIKIKNNRPKISITANSRLSRQPNKQFNPKKDAYFYLGKNVAVNSHQILGILSINSQPSQDKKLTVPFALEKSQFFKTNTPVKLETNQVYTLVFCSLIDTDTKYILIYT